MTSGTPGIWRSQRSRSASPSSGSSVTKTARTSRLIVRPKFTAWTTARLMPLTGMTTRCSRCGPAMTRSSRTCSSRAWSSYWRRMKSIIATRTGISTITSHAPSTNLTLVTTTATTAVATQPTALMVEPVAPARSRVAQPVPDHAGLADREVDEHADRVERDQRVGLAAGDDDQRRGEEAEQRRSPSRTRAGRRGTRTGAGRSRPRRGPRRGAGRRRRTCSRRGTAAAR